MILILRAAQVKEELLKYAQEAFGVNRNLSLFNTITMFINSTKIWVTTANNVIRPESSNIS